MGEQSDGWVYGWMDGWMDEQIPEEMNERRDGWMNDDYAG
jgi:hypothetical protein